MATLIINDEQKIEMETPDDESVLDLLLVAQSTHWNEAQTITELQVNGEAIVPLDEATLMAIPAEGTEIKVSLKEQQSRGIDQTLEEAAGYLQKLVDGFEELAPKIRDGNDASAYTMMKDGMEGLSTLLGLAENLSSRQSVPDDMRSDFADFLHELEERSQEMMDAQEGGDPTLIADILEFEFSEAAQELKNYFEKLEPYIV